MSQDDILEFLVNERASGNDAFFSIREIYKRMLAIGKATTTTRFCVSRLLDFEYLETNNKWPARVRANILQIELKDMEKIKNQQEKTLKATL